MPAVIIVFAKAPAAGAVKTRLRGAVTAEQAADLHRAFAADTLEKAAHLGADVELHTDVPTSAWPKVDRLQCPGDLGARMLHALTEALGRGYSQAMILGSDSPTLPAAHLRTLLESQADVALGPCEDGGYYAIACRRVHPKMFDGVAWGRPRALEQTVASAKRNGLRVETGATWYDVDEPADLQRLAGASGAPPHTASALAAAGLCGFPFDDVLAVELGEIETSRQTRLPHYAPNAAAPRPGRAQSEAHQRQLVGLAFSGGGIRSATFNLGVLQALASLNILPAIDYLSTVSGGGYIGSFLAAWIKRAGSIQKVAERLAQSQPAKPGEHSPVGFLRQYGNYLTPGLGVFSADTWTLASIYCRNLLLNLLIIASALGAVLLTPRFFLHLQEWASVEVPLWALCAAGGALLMTAAVITGMNFETFDAPKRSRWFTRQSGIQLLVVLPFCVASVFDTFSFWQINKLAFNQLTALAAVWVFLTAVTLLLLAIVGGTGGRRPSTTGADSAAAHPKDGASRKLAILEAAALVALAVADVAVLWRLKDSPRAELMWLLPAWIASSFALLCTMSWLGGSRLRFREETSSWRAAGRLLAGALVPGLVQGGLRLLMLRASSSFDDEPWALATFLPPAGLLCFLLTGIVHIGLMGTRFPDSHREWWSRAVAWMAIYCGAWILLFGVALYGPLYVGWGAVSARSWIAGAGAAWLVTTGAGILAGRGGRTGAPGGSGWRDWLVRLVPYVFVAGILVLVAHALQSTLADHQAQSGWQYFGEFEADYWNSVYPAPLLRLLLCALGLAAVAGLFSWTVDINEFSLHHFYRNRLVRCYLGASHTPRDPQPFTGFGKDDIPLASLNTSDPGGYQGPYPIVNACLNLTSGEQLAWQERQAASFVFTPKFFGYQIGRPAYRPTACAEGGGVGLGTAVAISGAAASPNMGYHSSKEMAFLLTVFDVRLGWWLGNTARNDTWPRSGPPFALWYLLRELLGSASERSDYVYLSDGGHFENLGIYELVRRRCRYLVVCDAEEDADMTFGGLGNAIRKCRTDLGVEIEIDVDSLRLQAAGRRSKWHCAVGTIHYETLAEQATPGYLVYLKASLSGDEETDIQNYASLETTFPHQSTADQWFDESQFESYRKLGSHVAHSVFGTAAKDHPVVAGREAFFVALHEAWYPPSSAGAAASTRHAAELERLYEALRGNPDLRFLDPQIYPEWPHLTAGEPPAPPAQMWLPAEYAQLRAGFYFCNSLIQVMESVYLDLDLEREFDHPDNRGWMNLFQHWAGSGMLRASWTVSAATRGVRFQGFCQRLLGLRMGTIGVEDAGPDSTLLNFEEKRRIRKLMFGRTGEVRILVLTMTVGDEIGQAPPRRPDLKFPFGFALERAGKVVYFRLQNHLRKTGLAREAVRVLIRERRIEAIDPAFLEVPARDVERFRRLFESVRREL